MSPDFVSVLLVVYIDAIISGDSFCGEFWLYFTYHNWSCKAKQCSFGYQNVYHVLEIIVLCYHIKKSNDLHIIFFLQLMIIALRRFWGFKFVAGSES